MTVHSRPSTRDTSSRGTSSRGTSSRETSSRETSSRETSSRGTGVGPAAFEGLFARHRHELRAHCYRMVGSVEDAEDLTQETFLRAWRGRGQFEGRSTPRAWLYRIATNACLDLLASRRRRLLPYQLAPPAQPAADRPPRPELPWLQPCPDRYVEPAMPADREPGAAAVHRETLELAFVAALQVLPARQRAVLVLRDVLGWSAAEVAGTLATSVPATNSALQRARATLRTQLGPRTQWPRPVTAPREQEILARFMAAVERADAAAIAALLLADARGSMPPYPMWYCGRDPLAAVLARGFALFGGFRAIATRANNAPAVALYRPAGGSYRAEAISVLDVRADGIAEITSFGRPRLFRYFGLPDRFPVDEFRPRARLNC